MKKRLRRVLFVGGGVLASAVLVIGYITESRPTPLDYLLSRYDIRVDVASGPGLRSATIEACGRSVALRGGAKRRHAKIYVDCETSGSLSLIFLDGTNVQCPAGYVAPGVSDQLTIRDGACPWP